MKNLLLTFLLCLALTWSWQLAVCQPTNLQNYVVTNTLKLPGIFTQAAVNSTPVASFGKNQLVDYVDGLGRPLQEVNSQASASQHDLISGIEFDNEGRQAIKYLTYADLTTTTTPGAFRSTWKTAQLGFYNGTTMPSVDADANPYAVSVLEPSPLNRLLAQGAPGTVWQPNTTTPYDPASHSVQTQYQTGLLSDNVRLFTIDAAGNINSSAFFGDGQLLVNVIIDEQQQTVKEYRDKSGQLVLKRVLIPSDVIETYYIYDNLEMLRAVIQPEGVAQLKTNNWVMPTGFSTQWLFLYTYDERKRLILKKTPGTDPVNLIYDNWDRLVLTQDGNLRLTNGWLFVKYDQMNRPIISGQITDARSLSVIQSAVAGSTGRFETVSTAANDGYSETNSFPSSSSYTLTVYTSTHYDYYTNLPTAWVNTYKYVNEYGISSQNNYVIGQVVGTRRLVLGSTTILHTETFYDDRYNLTQSSEDNFTGGYDRMTNIVAFDGKITNDYHTHTSRFFTIPSLTKQVYQFDPANRLLTLTHQIGSQEVVTINQNAYNEVGELLNKKLHQSPTHPTVLQKVDFRYLSRGFLKSINIPTIYETGYEESDQFNEELHYNVLTPGLGATAQYNGNIASIDWKNGYDEYNREFVYTYDQVNRLMKSSYSSGVPTGGAISQNFNSRYNEQISTFDHNGNIKGLTRYHGDNLVVDNLTYSFTGNLLNKVDDAAPASPVGFQDKTSTGNDYTYDPNGNLKSDYNKSISSITYNYLNLPEYIYFPNGSQLHYTYDGSGNKLEKYILDKTSGTLETRYYYDGDYVYKNDIPEFISQPEGRLRPVQVDVAQPLSLTNIKFIYDYYLKDHLGSVRSVLTTEAETDLYAATMELGAVAPKEEALFSNLASSRIAKPSGFDAVTANQQVSMLDGDPTSSTYKRVGPSIVLKVMAGDVVSVSTSGWYAAAVMPPPTSGVVPIVNELLPLLTQGVVAGGGDKGGSIASSTYSPLLTGDLNNFLNNQGLPANYSTSAPKAFLNWMVVDEEFAAVASTNHSGVKQMPVIPAGGAAAPIIGLNSLTIRRNGWIYIYLSNESKQKVYFDNLIINVQRGPLVEQRDYYSFGLEIPGLATQALKIPYSPNRLEYNGKEKQSKEFQNGTGLETYDYGARFYDPVIARWTSVDPLAEKMLTYSPYGYAFNNPIRFIDIGGQIPYPITVRAFHPDKYFGGGYSGDNRRYSTAPATARVTQIIDFDTDKSFITAEAWSSKSHALYGTFERRATPSQQISSTSSTDEYGTKHFGIQSHVASSNPLAPPGTPDVDVFSNLSITSKDNTLSITGKLTGDNFPSTEAFVSDPSGQSVFLGVGFKEGTPYTSLWGENKDRPITSFSLSLTTDDKGNFTGVRANGKAYTIADWNKQFQQADPYKNDKK